VSEQAAKSAAQRGAQITLLGAARAASRQTESGAQIGGYLRARSGAVPVTVRDSTI